MSSECAPVHGLLDHLFRRQAGRLVAALARLLGPDRLDLAEEVVQDAIVRALEVWPHRGVPSDPAAWLARVARNRAIDLLRREATLRDRLARWDPEQPTRASADGMDDELAMVFLCCHPSLPRESRVALTLKTVGGFGVTEIARAFLARPDAIAQRLVRAKRSLRDAGARFDLPTPEALAERIESVHDVLYLMFNEGYGAAQGDALVRAELCGEAMRLAERVAEGPGGDSAETDALLALMYLQASRLPARTDAAGALILLEDQPRERWDRGLIARGLRRLDRSARGGRETRYHLEAAIAACHAVAPSFEATDWARIEALYEQLETLTDSPVVALNRAVAIGMLHGPADALAFLDTHVQGDALQRYLPWHATLGELYRRSGDDVRAAAAFRTALSLPVTEPERAFLRARLAACVSPGGGFVRGA